MIFEHITSESKLKIILQLVDQLAFGGRLVVPIGDTNFGQNVFQIDKTFNGDLEKKSLIPVMYAVLTDKDSQCS